MTERVKFRNGQAKGRMSAINFTTKTAKSRVPAILKNEMTILRRLQRGSRVTLGPIHDVKQDAKPLVCRQLVDKDHAIQEFASQGTPAHGKRDMLVKALAL